MSEALEGLRFSPFPARPRDASACILWRRAGQGVELFWVRRANSLRFSAGFFAFPGGRVDQADSSVPVEGASLDQARLVAGAARELFEETGILRAPFPSLSAQLLASHRRSLLDTGAFADILRSLGAALHASDFVPAGRWITPDFAPIRFDTRFFLVELPADQAAEVWPGELAEGGWISPRRALERWDAGAAILQPPILNALRAFDSHGLDIEAALPVLREPGGIENHVGHRIELQRGLFVFPLETPTLPPARHTNCYVVGNREMLVVDPGAPSSVEQERLAGFVHELVAEGRRVVGIVLTHHHADHVGGALAAKRASGAPILAHALTADRVPVVDRRLEDGERLTLDGAQPMQLKVLHTPGHAPGHLCLVDERTRAVVCGDMISGASTIVVDPPEGDMDAYCRSLERLAALPAGVLYPAHGPTIVDGPAKIAEYLQHRAWRERLLLEVLAGGAADLSVLVAHAYRDTPAPLHPIARRSALAALIKLERQGKVLRDGSDPESALFRLSDS